ncbi:MAG TPA: hypothetical protein VD837_17845 [Terriglobales bacterium]|nr:hypothetical protein [Terriglobales bacterium]
MTKVNGFSRFVLATMLLSSVLAFAQFGQPGKSIGKISIQGELIVMELDEGALGHANLFDLAGRTLRFTPGPAGYKVENLALVWDAEFGPEVKDSEVKLNKLSFPFSGKSWDAFTLADTGVISFGPGGRAQGADPRGQSPRSSAGLPLERFSQLGEAAHDIINTVPAICVFLKPRMSGAHYVKELPDRVVITWDVTEPYGNIQDFTWVKTTNRFQAVLYKDGSIDMSYQQLAAKDAIIGLYPTVNPAAERVLATVKHTPKPEVAPQGIRNVKVSVLDNMLLKVTLEAGSPVASPVEAGAPGAYRITIRKPDGCCKVDWSVLRFGPRRGRQAGRPPRYMAFGTGVLPAVEASGNVLSVQGTLPAELKDAAKLDIQVEVPTPDSPSEVVDQVLVRGVKLAGIRSPEVDLSSLNPKAGTFPIVYESFHYLALPNPRDLACTVIKSLGDKFDFLAYYSDFRIDNQEAGTPSTGPLGGNVTGIGATQRGLESYCSAGRFQWSFVQPVYAQSAQMQEYPPADAPMGNTHDITFYQRQLGERTLDGKMNPYNYAVSQIAHELGHRWSAFVSAKVNGETIQLGPTHWARGLHAPVAFPYQRPIEASLMGGSYWQDNFDGTFTQLDDDYYVPATGWSYLELYLMGLISAAEVPDFFMLKNLTPAGRDANGHPIFKADRTKITIQDVIAAEGPRTPDVRHSQRDFNTGIVVIVEKGKQPSAELLERAEGIRRAWIHYWDTTTGHRSTMTATPNPASSAVGK